MSRDRPILLHVTTVPLTLMFLRGQVGFMREHGFDVMVASSPGEALSVFGREEGVRTHQVPMNRRITPLADLIAIFRLVKLFLRVRPTVVHAHTPKAGLLATLSAWLTRVPIRIYHIRGFPHHTATGLKRTMFLVSERLSCKLAHRVLAVSASLQQEALRLRLCPSTKVVVPGCGSGNGVDAELRFNPMLVDSAETARIRASLHIPLEATVFGFVGRLVRDKGIVELADAWSRMRETHADIHLVLVGPLEGRDPVPAASLLQLTSDSNVHFVGSVPQASLPAYYAVFDIVVHPSHREGFPNAPLEAAAMGLPVITTDAPGCVDAVIPERSGAQISVRNSVALENAMLRYLHNPELRHEHGLFGRRRVLKHFRPRDVWSSVHGEYLDLLASRSLKRY